MERRKMMMRFLRMVVTAAVMVAMAVAMPVSSSAAKPIIDGKTKPKPQPKYKPPYPKPKPDTKPEPKPKPDLKPQPKPEPPKPVRVERIEAKNKASMSPFLYGDVSFRLIAVDGGEYMMGCNSYVEEKPEHREKILPFLIGETEVTQALWEAVMGSNPSIFKGENRPVDNVSWHDCQEFVNKLNKIFNKQFRLPTEAEWEFAARGGNKSNGYKYAGGSSLYDYGWYADNSGSTTHYVKTKKPNELGLYDMCGNVFEWTSDLYSSSYGRPRNGGDSGMRYVFRGGGYNNPALYCRSTYRNHDDSSRHFKDVGLRLAMDAELVKNTYEVYPDGREQLISSVPYTE